QPASGNPAASNMLRQSITAFASSVHIGPDWQPASPDARSMHVAKSSSAAGHFVSAPAQSERQAQLGNSVSVHESPQNVVQRAFASIAIAASDAASIPRSGPGAAVQPQTSTTSASASRMRAAYDRPAFEYARRMRSLLVVMAAAALGCGGLEG